MWTPGVKKALTSRAKTEVSHYAYNEYMAHHYAFAMKAAAEQEPESPSLRHRLEGEKRPNRTKLRRRKGHEEPRNKAAKNRATKS